MFSLFVQILLLKTAAQVRKTRLQILYLPMFTIEHVECKIKSAMIECINNKHANIISFSSPENRCLDNYCHSPGISVIVVVVVVVVRRQTRSPKALYRAQDYHQQSCGVFFT